MHPGEVPPEEFAQPFGLRLHQLAEELNVPARRINEIGHRKRRSMADRSSCWSRALTAREPLWLTVAAHRAWHASGTKLRRHLHARSRLPGPLPNWARNVRPDPPGTNVVLPSRAQCQQDDSSHQRR
jgi:plasmid maintenance system antidote protein VapI